MPAAAPCHTETTAVACAEEQHQLLGSLGGYVSVPPVGTAVGECYADYHRRSPVCACLLSLT